MDSAPGDSALKLEIAAEAAALGRPMNALAAYQAVIGDGQISAVQRRDAAFAAGRIARDQRNRPMAIGFFEQAAALGLNDVQSRRDLADMYRAEQRFREAEPSFRRSSKVWKAVAVSSCRTPGFFLREL